MAKQKKQEQAPQADNNGIAVGEISIGGDVSGNIHIGHTNIYNAAEDDLPLSSDEIENGLTRFAQFSLNARLFCKIHFHPLPRNCAPPSARIRTRSALR